MRFAELLRATVLLSAGSATLLATLTVLGVARAGSSAVVTFDVAWWLVAAGIGIWLGRRAEANPPIRGLLADARSQTTLPELRPQSTLLNRLWPLLLSTVAAGVVSFFLPQVAAVATGFGIIWALAWRRQEAAVAAIEERDGVRFYVDRTSPLQPIRLIRTPGFGGDYLAYNGANGSRGAP